MAAVPGGPPVQAVPGVVRTNVAPGHVEVVVRCGAELCGQLVEWSTLSTVSAGTVLRARGRCGAGHVNTLTVTLRTDPAVGR